MTGIFISYRRTDSAGHAGWLHDQMDKRLRPGQLFVDIESILPGEDFVKVIENAVGKCDVMLVLIGPQWASVTDSQGRRRLDDPLDFVRLEVASALRRNIPVVPVLLNDARMPSASELPDDLKPLARRQAIKISNERFEHDVNRLLHSLKIEGITLRDSQPASSVSQKSSLAWWLIPAVLMCVGTLVLSFESVLHDAEGVIAMLFMPLVMLFLLFSEPIKVKYAISIVFVQNVVAWGLVYYKARSPGVFGREGDIDYNWESEVVLYSLVWTTVSVLIAAGISSWKVRKKARQS